MLKGFHNYMRGSVSCTVSGVRPERFLNQCVAGGIGFWDVQYVTPNLLTLSMSARDFRHIRPVARSAGCTLRLTRKRGALYSSRRMRRRYALIFGALVLGVFFWAMNSLILTIDVTGYERVAPAEILEAMKAEGVGVGTRVSMVDASRLRNKILLEIPELSWFTVTIRGCHAVVDVRERGDTPEVPDLSQPADIVADRTGVITILRVYRGEEQVEVGTMVQEGDLLVSGLVHLRLDEKTMLTHATADIYARVWHQATAAIPLDGYQKVRTGRKSVRYALALGNFRINFYKKGGKPFDKCDKISNRYEVKLSDGSTLPFALIRETYYEYETYAAPLDEQEHAAILSGTVQEMVNRQGEGSVVSELGLRAWVTDRVLYVRATGESVQKIGETVLRE